MREVTAVAEGQVMDTLSGMKKISEMPEIGCSNARAQL